MERKKGLLLTSKRKIKIKTHNFETAIDDLMKTPMKFGPEPAIPEIEFKTESNYKMRPSTVLSPDFINKGLIVEYTDDGRRRAFEKYFEHKVRASRAALNREWKEEERLRRWRSQKAIQETKSKYKKRDDKIIETIIQRRNEYYLSSLKADQAPFKLTIQNARYVGDDVMVTQSPSTRPSTTLSRSKFLS